MGYSIIRQIVSTISWSTFSIGILFNCILFRLILRHTPKYMQIYSRILMQNCITDIIFLVVTHLAEPVIFSTSKGANGRWLNGIVGQIQNPDFRVFGFMAFMGYVLCVYVSLFNYVVQFIYRYLVLNRSKTISACQYWAMLLGSLTIPLVYCVLLGCAYYPVNGREFLDDPAVAEILDLDISEGKKILLAGQITELSWMVTYGNYYIIVMCTLAYAIIWILGWKMHKFVKNRPMGQGNAGNWQKQEKIDEMNKQITRTLIIQACLPFTIYAPLILGLCLQQLGINAKVFPWMQYYSMLAVDPQWIPPAVNPIVAIFTIRHYRTVFIKTIQLLAKLLSCQFPSATMADMVGTVNSTMPNSNNININSDNIVVQQHSQPSRNGWIRK